MSLPRGLEWRCTRIGSMGGRIYKTMTMNTTTNNSVCDLLSTKEQASEIPVVTQIAVTCFCWKAVSPIHFETATLWHDFFRTVFLAIKSVASSCNHDRDLQISSTSRRRQFSTHDKQTPTFPYRLCLWSDCIVEQGDIVAGSEQLELLTPVSSIEYETPLTTIQKCPVSD